MNELGVLKSIQSVERFISSEVRLGLVSRGESSRQQFTNLAQLIRSKPQIDQAEATEALEHLEQDRDAFDDEQRRELASMIKACFQSRGSVAHARIVKRSEPQRGAYFQRYCPDSLWHTFRSNDSFDNKARHAVTFSMKHLGRQS